MFNVVFQLLVMLFDYFENNFESVGSMETTEFIRTNRRGSASPEAPLSGYPTIESINSDYRSSAAPQRCQCQRRFVQLSRLNQQIPMTRIDSNGLIELAKHTT